MHEFSLEFLRCPRCNSGLKSEILKENDQIDEGFLFCPKCKMQFPIIGKVPVLWNDFTNYLSNRPRLGGELFLNARTSKMKFYIKKTLGKIRKNPSDQSLIEKRWFEIYKRNKKARFYSQIKRSLQLDTKRGIALEHGCSIGYMTQHLAQTSSLAFGIDKSYRAIHEAKKSNLKNLDFFVADSLEHPFGKTKFDLVVGLNLFELIEPKLLLKVLASQVRKGGWLVLSDPYDFERGTKSVKEQLYEETIRKELYKNNFTITPQTKRPSYLSWTLKLHKRATLQYKVDLVVGKKMR